jgi:parvulin-like peptidyl-prolyl isomerase
VACCAAIVTAVAVGACGGGVPSGVVAKVGSATVLVKEIPHWMTVANNTGFVGTDTAPTPIPVPPDYTQCIAIHDATTSKSAAIVAAAKSACAASYQALQKTVVEFLVQGIWIQGEAVDRGVHVTDAQVVKNFDTERKSEFPTTAKFNTFLAEAGETVADLEWRTRLNLLQAAIVNKIKAVADKVTPAQIAAFYKAHIAEFSQPERRDLELVLVSTAATAAKVESLLAGGASYATVAKQYSIDPTTKDKGGVADGVEPNEETPEFNAQIFKAPIGVLQSPVRTAFGYYVFTVTKSLPASVESLTAATASIKSSLSATRLQAAEQALQTGFVAKWKKRTQCASAYLDPMICENAPTASTGASGTTAAAGATSAG